MATKIKPNRNAIRALAELCEGKTRAPRLKKLAQFINEWLPGLEAKIEKGWTSTDQKIAGTRFRIPGLGRTGNKLVVERRRGKRGRHPFFSHDASDPYRWNGEVVAWVCQQIGDTKSPWSRSSHWL